MKVRLASLLIRLGLAAAFFYAALASLFAPEVWISFLPSWIITAGLGRTVLFLFSLFQLVLGLWLLSGRRLYWSGLIAALTLFVIILVNITALDLIFRDIPIMLSALALMALADKE